MWYFMIHGPMDSVIERMGPFESSAQARREAILRIGNHYYLMQCSYSIERMNYPEASVEYAIRRR